MDQSTVEVSLPAPSFIMFEATRNGLAEFIVVNEALLSFVDTATFPWHLLVTLKAQELLDTGMPTAAEEEQLTRISDEIGEFVLSTCTATGAQNAQFLASTTGNGVRQLMFYVHDAASMNSAIQYLVASHPWARVWEYRMEEDAQWQKGAHMFQLFPQARGLQS